MPKLNPAVKAIRAWLLPAQGVDREIKESMYMSWRQGKCKRFGNCDVTKTLIIKYIPQKLPSPTQTQLYTTEFRPVVGLDLLFGEGQHEKAAKIQRK